jgi:hypothetical protein
LGIGGGPGSGNGSGCSGIGFMSVVLMQNRLRFRGSNHAAESKKSSKLLFLPPDEPDSHLSPCTSDVNVSGWKSAEVSRRTVDCRAEAMSDPIPCVRVRVVVEFHLAALRAEVIRLSPELGPSCLRLRVVSFEVFRSRRGNHDVSPQLATLESGAALRRPPSVRAALRARPLGVPKGIARRAALLACRANAC